jgi:putative proteasome-type protease
MTYGVGIMLEEGLVMAVDTRTNAGVDNIATFRKLHTWQQPGERVFVLLSSGNLAVTQAVVSLLTEGTHTTKRRGAPPNLFAAETMFQAARIVGEASREVRKADAEALLQSNESFHASFIFGGQIGTERPRLFQVYSAGNFIEASVDTPFLQIGEHKYGKPILVRAYDPAMSFEEAAKLLIVSFDSTLKSNLSVGLPLDIQVYETDSFQRGPERRLQANDPYYVTISEGWSDALREAFQRLPDYDELGTSEPAKLPSATARV